MTPVHPNSKPFSQQIMLQNRTPNFKQLVTKIKDDGDITVEDQLSPVQRPVHKKNSKSLYSGAQTGQSGLAEVRPHNKDIAKYLARASLIITTEKDNGVELPGGKNRQNMNTMDAIINH